MANLRDIRKRIDSVKNTQKITNAMKMVSAAKLRRAEDAIAAARPYSDKMREVLLSLAARTESGAHPMLETREVKKILLILITADRGLCGAFNSSLNRRAEAFVKQMKQKGQTVDILTVGRKANDYFRRREVKIAGAFSNVMNNVNFELAEEISEKGVEFFLEGEHDEVYLLYNSFKSAVTQVLTLKKLLPISPDEEVGRRREYLYEPSEEELLSDILPTYIKTQIFTGLLDSVASEHGARMTAMEAATSNADEMVHKLTLKLNRLRQESITTELMEIVGGAEALKG
jgi:F-type H+-transporting ATPase subunit gamma